MAPVSFPIMDANALLEELATDSLFDVELDNIPTQDLVFKREEPVETEKTARFRNTTTHTAGELDKKIKDSVPKRTQASNSWALKLFKDWRTWRQFSQVSRNDERWPIPSLEAGSMDHLDYWLSLFITEICRQDGSPYPPNTLNNIASGLQRFLHSCGRVDMKLLDPKDDKFCGFRQALNARRKSLLGDGIGTHTRQADPVTIEDERLLWESGALSDSTGQTLLYMMYFYNCKLFGFRALDEHTNLMADQFSFGQETNGDKYIRYEGRLSKTVNGAIDSKGKPKDIKHYATPSNPRCVVPYYEKYLDVIGHSGRFYRRSLPPRNGDLVFSQQPVGVNTLRRYMKAMFNLAGIDYQGRNISNHSGKVTCCTRLYEANFDEQAITARSGHRSNAVRSYKRPSLDLQHAVSDVLQPPRPESAPPAIATSDLPSPKRHNFVSCPTTPCSTVTPKKESGTLHITVPSGITTVIIEKDDKTITVQM